MKNIGLGLRFNKKEPVLELVVLRHGESVWNQENRFTGWEDVDLSAQGEEEARRAGRLLAQREFDVAYTSVLKRAIRTLNLALDEMNQTWLPVFKDWRLNERHYGALTGLNKAETAAQHGEEQVRIWRRSFDVLPPPLATSDPRHPRFDRRYQQIATQDLPTGESLKTTIERFVPLWKKNLQPLILEKKRVLIVAHGNSLRALLMLLEQLSPDQIMEENIPTGIPLLFELEKQGEKLSSRHRRYLGDAQTLAAALEKVKNQGKAKT